MSSSLRDMIFGGGSSPAGGGGDDDDDNSNNGDDDGRYGHSFYDDGGDGDNEIRIAAVAAAEKKKSKRRGTASTTDGRGSNTKKKKRQRSSPNSSGGAPAATEAVGGDDNDDDDVAHRRQQRRAKKIDGEKSKPSQKKKKQKSGAAGGTKDDGGDNKKKKKKKNGTKGKEGRTTVGAEDDEDSASNGGGGSIRRREAAAAGAAAISTTATTTAAAGGASSTSSTAAAARFIGVVYGGTCRDSDGKTKSNSITVPAAFPAAAVDNTATTSSSGLTSVRAAQRAAIYSYSTKDDADSGAAKTKRPAYTYKKEGRPKKQRRIGGVDDEGEPDPSELATPAQVRDREARRRGRAERTEVRRKWQRRKYDLRQEPDVGGAVQRALQLSSSRQQQQQLGGSEATVAGSKVDGNDGSGDSDGNIRSDDADTWEDDDILNRLMRGSQDKKKRNDGDDDDDDQAEGLQGGEVSRPYGEGIGYWELGKHAPDRDALKTAPYHAPQVKTGVLIDATVSRTNHRRGDNGGGEPGGGGGSNLRGEGSDLSVKGDTVASVMTSWYSKKEQNSHATANERFPLNRDSYSSLKFVHRRQLVRLAARHVVGAAGLCAAASEKQCNSAGVPDDSGVGEDFLIQSLWNTDLDEAFQSTMLVQQAGEQGRNLQVFTQLRWKDSESKREAARQLGLLPEMQLVGPPDMLGYTLASATNKVTHENERKKVIREYAVGAGANANENGWIPWGPVQADSMTRSASYAASKKRKIRKDDAELVLHPDIRYVPVPGAVPPIPPLPLDLTSVVFGPVDKYHFVSHRSASFHDVSSNVTLSWLLSRLSEADNGDEEQIIRDQIIDIVGRLCELTCNSMYKRFANTDMKCSEIPLSAFAKAVTAFFNVAANLFSSRLVMSASHKNASTKAEQEGDGRGVTSKQNRSFFDGYDAWMEHSGLALFAPLHITFGILQISRVLLHNQHAVDILSSPLDTSNGEYQETPFEKLRALLEFLESTGSLIDGAVPSSASNLGRRIIVGEMEYALHHASISFSKAVERDPTEVGYLQWHLASLAGSLLLCSGNRIGGVSAYRYPSNLALNDSTSLLQSLKKKSKTSTHEVRRVLPRFQDLRVETARAFRVLLTLSSHQHSVRANRAVVSFLEWKQAVALLIGPVGLSKSGYDPFADIRLLHRHHYILWAQQETSAKSLHAAIHRCDLSPGSELDFLACALESDPSVKEHWARLAMSLGTFSKLNEHKLTESSERKSLVVTSRIEDGSQLDSSWKADRNWWNASLLRTPCFSTDNAPVDLVAVARAFEKRLEGLELFETKHRAKHRGGKERDPSLRWLDEVESGRSLTEDSPTPSLKARNKDYKDFLPPNTTDERVTMEFTEPQGILTLKLQGNSADEIEILFYRIIIRGHLFGLEDVGVGQGIRHLAVCAWDEMTKSLLPNATSLAALEFLYRLNINVPCILLCQA